MLSRRQVLWLLQQGGRTEFDVGVDDDNQKFVMMGNGHRGYMKVEVPSNGELLEFDRQEKEGVL